MVRALGEHMAETLPLGRALIRLTIERAVAPLRDRLDEAQWQRLVSALALVIGWEAFIVLGDVRGLPASEQIEVTAWAARALVSAALAEAEAEAKATPREFLSGGNVEYSTKPTIE